MPRKRRILLPGEIAHIMSRGHDGCDIFHSNDDRNIFLSLLDRELSKTRCYCLAWSLMPNHYHLVLRLSDQDAGPMMRRLNGSYAQYFNRTHGRRGYLFQDRYKSLATRDLVYARELIRYVHLNPLRAKLVSNLDDLERYPWTGHAEILGFTTASKWMNTHDALSKFGSTTMKAREAYLAFIGERVSDAPGQGPFSAMRDLSDEAVDDRILGSAEFVVAAVAKHEYDKKEHAMILQQRPLLYDISKNAAKRYGVNIEATLSRGRLSAASAARAWFCLVARTRYGYTLVEIAGYLGITTGAVVHAMKRAQDLCGEKVAKTIK